MSKDQPVLYTELYMFLMCVPSMVSVFAYPNDKTNSKKMDAQLDLVRGCPTISSLLFQKGQPCVLLLENLLVSIPPTLGRNWSPFGG